MVEEYVLKAKNIVKQFPGVCALDKVNLEVKNGEIVGIAGANGAGKSTLVKIISGAYRPDSGEIYFNGEKVNFFRPRDAQKLGINVAYQEINLVPNMSVTENVFLGQEKIKIKSGYVNLIDKKKQRLITEQLLAKLGMEHIISPDMKVKNLGSMQLAIIQIAKALVQKSNLLIMDEPTSLLSQIEINILFNTMKQIIRTKSNNMGIIFITHHLKEFEDICNRVMVLKDGKQVGTLSGKSITVSTITNLMISGFYNKIKDEKKENIYSENILEVEDLTLNGVFKDISLTLKKGEIVVLTGLVGAGKTELLMTIFGAYTSDFGRIKINKQEVQIKSPIDAVKMGMGLVPEERKLQGLFIDLAISKNITISGLEKVSKWRLINRRSQNKIADTFIKKLNIKARGPKQLVTTLSGGNQQKVVISKWMMIKPQILLVDDLTRGLDVGAKAEVSNLMKEMAQQGVAILMSANEISEVLAISDRVLVMSNGKIVAELESKDTNESKILELSFEK